MRKPRKSGLPGPVDNLVERAIRLSLNRLNYREEVEEIIILEALNPLFVKD